MWSYKTRGLTRVQPLDGNTDIFLYPNAADTRYLKRMTFHTQAEAEKQQHRETLAFGHSHQNIIETLEVALESDGQCWFVYVFTPYLLSLSQDMKRRKVSSELYRPEDLWTYMRDLVGVLAYLQEKVRSR